MSSTKIIKLSEDRLLMDRCGEWTVKFYKQGYPVETIRSLIEDYQIKYTMVKEKGGDVKRFTVEVWWEVCLELGHFKLNDEAVNDPLNELSNISPTTIVTGIVCNSCGLTADPHTVEEHLDKNNPIHKCAGGHKKL